MKKHTAHSLTIKHKKGKVKHKSAQFTKNRKEEEMEQTGKMKHATMKCKSCGSMKHKTHPKKKAALQTAPARFEKMRRKVFGLK